MDPEVPRSSRGGGTISSESAELPCTVGMVLPQGSARVGIAASFVPCGRSLTSRKVPWARPPNRRTGHPVPALALGSVQIDPVRPKTGFAPGSPCKFSVLKFRAQGAFCNTQSIGLRAAQTHCASTRSVHTGSWLFSPDLLPFAVRARYKPSNGEVAEWSKAHAWKVCRRETVSWVRIPPSPPLALEKLFSRPG